MSIRCSRPAVPLLLLALLAPFSALAETAPQGDGALQFTGDSGRVSIGYLKGGHLQGELMGVLSESGQDAWLGEGWFSRSAGGLQLSYHRATDLAVSKYFVAADQNAQHDRKLSLGYGQEREDWFGNAYLSRGFSQRRQIGQSSISTQTLSTGSEDGRPYQETLTSITTTRIFERAYDYGVGLRLGRYLERSALRLTGGLDYEWGQGKASQANASFMAEKFFIGTPHSLALQLDHYRKQGDLEADRNGNRVLLSYRYSFGKTNHQPEQRFRMVADAKPTVEPTVIPAHSETRMVKTTASMSSDAFFSIGSTQLTDTARRELDRVAELLKQNGHEGNIRIVGHTCDIGSNAVNDKLSVKRAEAVRDYLAGTGALSSDQVILEGKGKREPKYPATAATREKNRRVDLEFVSIVEQARQVEIPAQTLPAPEAPVSYHREVVSQEPAWLRQALRSPAAHKRDVDVYRSEERSQSEQRQRTWINRAPVAQADSFNVLAGSSSRLNVLANDRDPDNGDQLKLLAVSSAAHGQVSLDGDQLLYVAAAGFSGQDVFSYTVQDGQGASVQGQVTVNVTLPNHGPVANNDTFVVSGIVSSQLAVLDNDSDPDGDTLTITNLSQPANGTVTVVGSRILFTPAHSFWRDSFSYTVSDGHGGQATATVTLIDP